MMDKEPGRYMLVADGWVRVCNMILNDKRALVDFVHGLVDAIDMDELGLHVHEVGTDVDSGPGLSVVSVITTSHIAVHTWPGFSYFMLDIASCKAFSYGAALGHTSQGLGVSKWNTLFSYPFGHVKL